MAAENDEQIAGKLVTGFIKEMNDWEQFCNDVEEDSTLTYEQQVAKQKEKVEEIFSRYCTKKERKNGRPNTISYGVAPSYEYDVKEEKIESIVTEDTDRIAVNTARTKPMPEHFIYVVLKVHGNWLIDSKKRESVREKKWKVVSL